MIKKTLYIFAVILFSLLFVSCNKDKPAYNRENIKATWLVHSIDGNELSVRDCYFMTFDNASRVTYYGISTTDTGYVWDSNRLRYEVYCCDLTIEGEFSGLFGYMTPISVSAGYDFISHEDSAMVLGVRKYAVNGSEVTPEHSRFSMKKLPQKYAATDSVSGIWQFNTKNGEEFVNYRVRFGNNGGFMFYTKIGENEWSEGNGTDTYSLYDKFMAVTLYDNSVFGTSSKWDVACFIIETASKTTNRMVLRYGEDSYVLSFISAD